MANSPVSLRNHLRMLFRRKWAVVLPCFAAVFVVPLYVSNLPPKYRARVLLKRRDLAVFKAAPESLVSRGGVQESVDALREEILSRSNLERVIAKTKQDVGLHTPADWQRLYEHLRDATTIRRTAQGPGLDLIEVAVILGTPELAAETANALGDIYVSKTKEAGRSDIEESVKFLADGTEEYRRKLKEAEFELEKYRQTKYPDLPQVKADLQGRIYSLYTDKEAREIQLAAVKRDLAGIAAQLSEVPQTIKIAETTTEVNPVAVELQNQLIQRQRMLAVLSAKYTAEHPGILELREEIAAIEALLKSTPTHLEKTVERVEVNPTYQALLTRKFEFERQVQSLEGSLLELGARLLALENRLREVQKEEKTQADLERAQAEHSEIYQTYRRALTAAQTRLRIESGEYGTQVDFIERAQAPALPYRLNQQKAAAVLALAALAFGFALVFVLEFSDRSIRDIEDATAILNVPVLASVPTILTPRETFRHRVLRGSLCLAMLAAVGIGTWHFRDFWAGIVGFRAPQLAARGAPFTPGVAPVTPSAPTRQSASPSEAPRNPEEKRKPAAPDVQTPSSAPATESLEVSSAGPEASDTRETR